MITYLIFDGLKEGLRALLLRLFILAAMVFLVKAVLDLSRGEKDSSAKAVRWLLVTAIGLILLSVI